MRASIERDSAAGADAYGGAPVPNWQPHATLACYAWSRSKKVIVDGDKTAVMADLRCVFPAGSDVTEDDRVAQIADRQGAVKFQGPYKILTLQPRKGQLEAMLEKPR